MTKTRLCSFQNVGNSCYLNVALHVFLSLRSFRFILETCFIHNNDNIITFLSQCHSCSLTTDHVHDPRDVYDMYINMFRLKRNDPEDMVECVVRLIDYFSKQFCFLISSSSSFFHVSDSSLRDISSVMSECACYDKLMSFISRIDHVFTGIYSSSIVFSCCKRISCTINDYKVLPFHVSSSQNVYSCLNEFMNTETIDHVYCDTCNTQTSVLKTSSFHRFPKVLMFDIVASTSHYTIKIDHEIVIDHSHVHQKYKYHLQCVVIYDTGHYTCLVKDDNKPFFRLFNDHHVSSVVDMTNMTIPQARLIVYERN